MTDQIADKIRASFASQSLMQSFGATLTRIGTGEVEIIAPISAGAQQQHGFAHAGLTFAIGDSAAGYAALSLMGPQDEVLTAEMKINLTAPGKGDRLRARGRVIKPGRRLMVVSAEVFALEAGQETLIALMQGTMIPVHGARPAS